MREFKKSADVYGSTTITIARNRVSPPTGGLCDCLRIPHKVRPLPFKSKDQEMVETRPGRLIRVIHLLPSKRSRKTKPETLGQNGSHSFGNYHRQNSNLEPTENTTTLEFSRLVVHADVTERNTNTGGGNETNTGDEIENDEDEENSLNGDESKYRFSPVYGFENPFHPKNYLYSDDDELTKINSFAEYLATTILDDALLELGTLWRLILPSNLEDKGHTHDGSSNRCFFLDDELDENYRTWSSCVGGFQLNGSLHFEKPLSRTSFSSARELREWESGVDNPSFDVGVCDVNTDVNEFSVSVANGTSRYSSFNNYKYPSASSPLPTRSSFSSCNGQNRQDSKLNISRTLSKTHSNYTRNSDENNATTIDQVFRIYRHPGGDEIASLPSTSFQSSTWGSSANSSLRYIRRFASKKFKTKPLICFIHGIGDSAELWNHQSKFFQEKGYETVAWDLIGHGLSSAPDKPKAYTFDVILTDVLTLFDRYSRDRNVIIGHSYGCCFAAAVARLRSKQVAHLILISGGGPFPLYPHPKRIHLPSCLVDCFRSLRSCGARREMFYVPYRKQMRPIDGFDLPSYVVKYMIGGQVWLEGDANFHKQITVPTLLIYGLKDPYVNLVEECEMEKTIPRAFLELIPEASHMVMLETPDQVNDMMYKFLRRWNR